MSNAFKSIIYLLLITLFSCKYSPIEIPETDVKPISPNEASISFELTPYKDTIKVFEPTTLLYNINTLEKKLYKIEYYIDDILIETLQYFNDLPYSFHLNTNNLSEGIYQFKILVYTNSNSGSFADKLGAEGFLFELKWPLIVDKTPPRSLNYINIDSVEKGVKISWEIFDHGCFKYYKLLKSSVAFAGNQELTTIYDPKINSFIDEEYMEGMRVTYEIRLNEYWPLSKEYLQLPPKPSIKPIKGLLYELSCPAPKNINLLDYYYLHLSPNGFTISEELKMYDPDKRTKQVGTIFGENHYYGIVYAPKSTNYLYPSYLVKGGIEFMAGAEMPIYKYALPIQNTSNIIMSKSGYLYKYNLTTGITSNSMMFNCDIPDYFTLSNDGKNLGYSENGKFIVRSTLDFSEIFSLVNDEYSNHSKNLYMYRISTSNRLLTVQKDNKITVYDLETNNKIAEKAFVGLNWITARITPDGNYIITEQYDNRIHVVYYKIIGDQIVELGRVEDSELMYGDNLRNPFGPDQDIYIVLPEKVEIRNIVDFSIKEILQIRGIQRIDYGNMTAIRRDDFYSGSYVFQIVDIPAGNTIKSLNVKISDYLNYHSNYLFNEYGRKLNLNDL